MDYGVLGSFRAVLLQIVAIAFALSSQQILRAEITVTYFGAANSTVIGTMTYYGYGITGSYQEERLVGYRYDPATGSYFPITEIVTVNTYGPVSVGTVQVTATPKFATGFYDPDGPGPIAPQPYTVFLGHEATFPDPHPGHWAGGVTWQVSA